MSKISHKTLLSGEFVPPPFSGELDIELAWRLYRFMVRLRVLQEKIIEEYHPADEMRCPIHFVIGQEAVPAVLSELVLPEDYLFDPHRSHGLYLAKGGTMNSLLAEVYGKASGANGGRAGSQEISSPALRFHSGAILSGLLGVAVGVGLGFSLKAKQGIAIVGLGDGAVDEGVFWEAVNYAELCKLPVVFVCENNGYSTYSPQLKRQTLDNIHEKVAAFGLKSRAVFGNDVLSLFAVLKETFDSVREGNGPAFVEVYTYRWKGHVGPEDDDYVGYRSSDEISFWHRNCPIQILEKELRVRNLWSDSDREKMIAEAQEEVVDAFAYAKSSAFPENCDWLSANYAQETPVADKLLIDATHEAGFDAAQDEAVPGPY